MGASSPRVPCRRVVTFVTTFGPFSAVSATALSCQGSMKTDGQPTETGVEGPAHCFGHAI